MIIHCFDHLSRFFFVPNHKNVVKLLLRLAWNLQRRRHDRRSGGLGLRAGGFDGRPRTLRGSTSVQLLFEGSLYGTPYDVQVCFFFFLTSLESIVTFPIYFQDISFLLIYPFPFPICFFEVNESTITLWSLYRADNETPVFLIGPKRPIPVLVTSKMLWGKWDLSTRLFSSLV